MRKIISLLVLMVVIIFHGCDQKSSSMNEMISELEGIRGTQEYKSSSYITAGNRLYSVGSQDGTFPEIGWHITGEMGGIWDHPIKLLDGFSATIKSNNAEANLDNAEFVNYPMGNKLIYELSDLGLIVNQVQFVPDNMEGMVIEYEFINNSMDDFIGEFKFTSFIDLRPTWLWEQSNMIDGADDIYVDEGLLSAKDSNNDWYCIIGSSEMNNSHSITGSPYEGNGKIGELTYSLDIKANQSKIIKFYIVGSYQSKSNAENTLKELKDQESRLFKNKMKRYQELENSSRLTTHDENFNQIYRWIKYNSDWFVREVPEFGKGIAAGYPDYPWWFGCDSEYALQGYLSIGSFDLVKSNIDLLANFSKNTNENGRIVHEVSTNGVVFNPGNVNETPQFISLVWNAYLWTGDQSILEDNFDLIRKGIDWLLIEKDENRNGFPEGAGMMEVHGLESEMIDVASYTHRGIADAAEIAKVLGEVELSEKYERIASELKEEINDVFWVEDFSSFGDFIANDHQTLELIDAAIVRADTLNKPWAIEELKETKNYILNNPSSEDRSFVLHHNWVVNTPMEMNIADPEKADKALQTARKFVNPFGVFVTGIDRDESAGKETGSFKGSKIFSYTSAVMTLPTGVSAISENNYGNPDQALDYLKRMGRSFSYALPGSIYEVSPDYGMFSQAWNIYSYAVPVVQQFFGIKPIAAKREITIQPMMPEEWEFASLENVKVGSNAINIYYKIVGAGYSLTVSSQETDWDIDVLSTKGYQLEATNNISENKTEYRFIKI